MLEKCILARHKAGVYLRCNYLNKFTKIVLRLVEWTQLTTWIVGINLVSKTFCWKKTLHILCNVYHMQICVAYMVSTSQWRSLYNSEWALKWINVHIWPSRHEIFDSTGAFACDNRSFVSVLHAFREKKCTIRNVFASFLPSRAVLEANSFVHLSPAYSLVKISPHRHEMEMIGIY